MSTEEPAASAADVPTQRAGRYAKQLSAHLGRRLSTGWDDEAGVGTIAFDDGECTMTATTDSLALRIHAPDPDLDRIEGVVGRHLVRFGTRDELVVQWQRSDGTAGLTFRNDDEPDHGHDGPPRD